MIYTRKINDKTGILDYSGAHEELRLEMFMTIKSMIESEDLESRDLSVMILCIFKELNDVDKLTVVDMLTKDIKGGSLWQELEDLSKSEKK